LNAPIDQKVAWDLVRAVPPVEASGRWDASRPLTDAAREILDLYLPLQVPARLVIAQMGQSLDGRIATESGHSQFVTGPADIRRLHRVRALVDAVVVGAETVAVDDPRLTVRECSGDDPVRVILDPDGRVDPCSEIFAPGTGRTVAVRRARDGGTPGLSVPAGAGVDPAGRTGPGATGSAVDELIELPVTGPRGFDPQAVLAALEEQGIQRVLVEGGGITVSRFLQAGALDRLHITVAPVLFGSGRPALTLDPIETIDQALRPRCRVFALGDDLLYDLELR